MAERLNALVLKTSDCQRSESSNLSPSAKIERGPSRFPFCFGGCGSGEKSLSSTKWQDSHFGRRLCRRIEDPSDMDVASQSLPLRQIKWDRRSLFYLLMRAERALSQFEPSAQRETTLERSDNGPEGVSDAVTNNLSPSAKIERAPSRFPFCFGGLRVGLVLGLCWHCPRESKLPVNAGGTGRQNSDRRKSSRITGFGWSGKLSKC